jgi:D-alanine-D-alanine ligase
MTFDMSKRPYHSVAVLKGGPSAERDISLKSGAAVARGLRDAGYDVLEVDVVGHEVVLPDSIEAVFIALHGEFGEDGQVQCLLDAMEMPYTGSGEAGSRIAMDKVLTKQAFATHGIPSPAYEVLTQESSERTLPLPVVIKPVSQGSSIGVHLVASEQDWNAALSDAFHYGDRLLVEAFVPGRELTVGVVDKTPLPVLEIVAPDGWYGYDAKYTKGKTEYSVPAEIDATIADEAQQIALRVFDALSCEGVGRVDFRLTPEGLLQVLELNSIPGFTETSLLPKSACAAGMTFSELCDKIMRTANNE